jgi:hypothetical protein
VTIKKRCGSNNADLIFWLIAHCLQS